MASQRAHTFNAMSVAGACDWFARGARCALCALWVLTLGSCADPRPTGAGGPKWQVVRSPGTSSCAAVVLVYPGVLDHPEQIGVYDTQKAAEAALELFKTTRDTMTVTGQTICQ
jgi:hypothetical protein